MPTAQYLYNLVKNIRAVRITLVKSLHYFVVGDCCCVALLLPARNVQHWITGAILWTLLILLCCSYQGYYQQSFWRIGFSTLLVSFAINLYLNHSILPLDTALPGANQAALDQ